ncbi:glutamate 5-kinase [Desulfonispora thiosulfatigenes DSM 11270]|uniref:Glutamate 5-kinase n=1 Tax=Desulfonispora thiosulfatigenes DSM 11270 TaxID=656914 RepID=A0A1W1UHU9_DESTI|nr:glutamate 5-kinase [Desulfonispora thiosulfatigenes]SMB80334.1 glutamate 5-kinase [Desulfonispora thiosulfatigenes DSM 11270]
MCENEYKNMIKNAHRIVFKVGTSTLTHSTGKLNLNLIEKLVRQLADLIYQGKEVLLVTSGAVGAGMGVLGFKDKPRTIPEKQACAAVGQGVLVHIYEKIFSEYGAKVAQLLLTRADLNDRNRFLNARNTLLTLLKCGVVPIINENDTVAVDEMKFGDNDTLSSLVAGLVDADLLLLLSDIDGLYTGDPNEDPNACLIETVEEIDESIESVAGGAGSKFASGGMITKVLAAKIAVKAGIPMIITNGIKIENISRIFQGEKIGTLFIPPKEVNTQTRKRWIAFSSKSEGKIWVDCGAFEAINDKGKSLLPRGIVKIEGSFNVGHVVSIINHEAREFARGIVNYDSSEIEQIKGVKCEDIIKIIGHKDYDEVIHRDNLAIR